MCVFICTLGAWTMATLHHHSLFQLRGHGRKKNSRYISILLTNFLHFQVRAHELNISFVTASSRLSYLLSGCRDFSSCLDLPSQEKARRLHSLGSISVLSSYACTCFALGGAKSCFFPTFFVSQVSQYTP